MVPPAVGYRSHSPPRLNLYGGRRVDIVPHFEGFLSLLSRSRKGVYIAPPSDLMSRLDPDNHTSGGVFKMSTQVHLPENSHGNENVQGTPTLSLLSQDLFKPYSHQSAPAESVAVSYLRAQAIGRAYGIYPFTS